ncbi:hypothetical protein ACLQ28_15270 [Micromonospora sp. DT201]|uniref:hypothetical protein n=1 Tax=Micromonospora sp. DT201 TaxID=3393442 RepID=UPI003CF2D74B
MGIERAVREVGYTLRVVATIEGDPGGIASALASLLDQGVDGVIISEPIDEGVGLISVDVPVLVLGAPPTFAAPQVVTARVGSRGPRPSTCWCWGTRPSITWPARSGGIRHGTVSPAGARRCEPTARTSRRSSRATGRPRPATRRAGN